jgi:hypothetical protein
LRFDVAQRDGSSFGLDYAGSIAELSSVPEPGVALLMILGLVSIGCASFVRKPGRSTSLPQEGEDDSADGGGVGSSVGGRGAMKQPHQTWTSSRYDGGLFSANSSPQPLEDLHSSARQARSTYTKALFGLRYESALRGFMTVLACWMFTLTCSPAVSADPVSYAYTGNTFSTATFFYNCTGTYSGTCNTDFVTASFTLPTALVGNLNDAVIAPSSFSLSDGNGLVITPANAPVSTVFEVSTDASGNVSDWLISACVSTSSTCGLGDSVKEILTSSSLSGLLGRAVDLSFAGTISSDVQQCLAGMSPGATCPDDPGLNLAVAVDNGLSFGDTAPPGTWTVTPEIDPTSGTSAIALLAGAILVFRGRRTKMTMPGSGCGSV